MEENTRRGLSVEELERMKAGLTRGSRYRLHEGSPLESARAEWRPLSRDILSNMRYDNEINIKHAHILHALYVLGHATPNMVQDLMKIWKKNAGNKTVPELKDNEAKSVLSLLARKGLVMCQRYNAERHQVRVYTITSFGFTLFRAILDLGNLPYDMSAMYRCEKEIYKQLAVNAVVSEFGRIYESEEVLYHGRFGGFDKYSEIKDYLYGALEIDDVLYLMEPAYFRTDGKIETEMESEEKVGKRLLQIPYICDKFKKTYQKDVRIVFIVEDAGGALKLVKLLKGMDDSDLIFQKALVTCENLFYQARGNMNEVFFSWFYDEEGGKKGIKPVGSGWMKKE